MEDRRFLFKEEVLLNTDGWKCGCWNMKGTFTTESFSLTEEPTLLIIHLKRFDGSTRRMIKRAEPVAVPLQFEQMASKFHLRGLVRHHGQTLSRGHYTAEVKEDEEWWVYAYLLFYENET